MANPMSHLGYLLPRPPTAEQLAADGLRSWDKPAHVSDKIGRALIGLSVAPIPVVAPLLRLVVRPVAGELQRSTNRQLIDKLNTLGKASDQETKMAAFEHRSNVLRGRACCQLVRPHLQPSSYHKLASVFNYLAVPALALAATSYIPALTNLPVLSGIAIPGLLPAVAVTLVGLGCVWGLEAFNTWRDRIEVQETKHQSSDFFVRQEYIHNENTVKTLRDENEKLRNDRHKHENTVKTLRDENDKLHNDRHMLAIENGHLKNQRAAPRPQDQPEGSENQETVFDPGCADLDTVKRLYTEEYCRMTYTVADLESRLQSIEELTGKHGEWLDHFTTLEKASTGLSKLRAKVRDIASPNQSDNDQGGVRNSVK